MGAKAIGRWARFFALLAWTTACGAADPGPDFRIARIALTPDDPVAEVGESLQFELRAFNRAGEEVPIPTVTWKVDDSRIAAVDGNGLFLALQIGTTGVEAEVAGFVASSQVKVERARVATVTLLPSELYLKENTAEFLRLRVEDRRGGVLLDRHAQWVSDDPSIASVQPSGRVEAHAMGKTIVRATVEGVEAEAPVTVLRLPVLHVEASAARQSLFVGESMQIQVRAYSPYGEVLPDRPAAWTTSDPGIATVDGNGKVVAVAEGAASIVVSIEGKIAVVDLEVQRRIDRVAIADKPSELLLGETIALRVDAFDAEGKPISDRQITWSSEPPGVVKVDESGTLRTLAAGEATIRVDVEGHQDSFSVRVVEIDFIDVFVGGNTSCGVAADHALWCWGALPDGRSAHAPERLAEGYSVRHVAVASGHLCFLTLEDQTYCLGDNSHGQLGDGTLVDSFEPVAVSGGHAFESLIASRSATCGLTSTGEVFCWGANASGHFGRGDYEGSDMPVEAFAGMQFARFAMTANSEPSDDTACGLTSAGEVLCAGSNAAHLLGAHPAESSSVPVAVAQGEVFAQLALASETYRVETLGHACGIDLEGKLKCWGNSRYALEGAELPLLAPMIFLADESFRDLAVVAQSGFEGGGILALREDGLLRTKGNWAIPQTPPPTLFGIGATLTAGYFRSGPDSNHLCAIGADGVIRCLFGNADGQLGNGAWRSSSSIEPVVVLGQLPAL